MIRKTHLAVACAALSLATIASTTAVTLSWFITHSSSTITHSSVTVNADAANVSMALTYIHPSAAESVDVVSTVNIPTEMSISDLSSGFGNEFFRRRTGASGYEAISGNDLEGKVLQYGLAVNAKPIAVDATLKVTGTIVAGQGTASTNLANWLRIGILEMTDNTYQTPVEEGFKKAIVLNGDNVGWNYIRGSESPTMVQYASSNIASSGQAVDVVSIEAQTDYIGYYLVSIWMEGTLASDQDSARSGSASVSISFGE